MKYVKLKDILTLEKGKEAIYKDDGKYEVFGAGVGSTGRCDEYNNDGNIIITRQASVGKIYWRRYPHWVQAASCIIKVDENKVFLPFLYHWLKSKEWLLTQLKVPSMIPTLDEYKFLNLEIPLPPYLVQVHAAATIDYLEVLNLESTELIQEEINDYTNLKKITQNKLLTFRKDEDNEDKF